MLTLAIMIEVIGILIGFGIAAEFVARGTTELEPVIGQGVTGGVILGLLGALPETMFVVIAVLGSSYNVALGSALGGNVILFTLGMGMVGVVYFLKWKKDVVMKDDYHVESNFLLLATAALVLLTLFGKLGRISGSILFLIYLIYIVHRYIKARSFIAKNLETRVGREVAIKGALYLISGAVIVIALSGSFVQLIITISEELKIPALWLALVVSPIAAELEENLGAYKIARKTQGGGSTAIVSFIGGKLQNNTMLLGLIGVLATSPVDISGATPEFITVIAINLIALFAIRKGKLTYMNGIALVLLYFAAILVTFIA